MSTTTDIAIADNRAAIRRIGGPAGRVATLIADRVEDVSSVPRATQKNEGDSDE